MMFTDLESFTDMCERIGDPQRIVETLNGYFERTTGSIFDHDGVIIKFLGDAIFAAWGAPLADPEAAAQGGPRRLETLRIRQARGRRRGVENPHRPALRRGRRGQHRHLPPRRLHPDRAMP